MFRIILFLTFAVVSSVLGIRACNKGMFSSGYSTQPPPSPAPAVSAPSSPAPASSVPQPARLPRRVVKRDFGVSWWGDSSTPCIGGQGQSGIVWDRPPDGWCWQVPFWLYEQIDEDALKPLSPVAGPHPETPIDIPSPPPARSLPGLPF